MIETVFIFALVTALGEWAVLAKCKPRTRLRLLGHPGAITACAFAFNLWVHWGTVVGSMTAITAALASMATTEAARKQWGYIVGDVVVYGRKKYPIEELR